MPSVSAFGPKASAWARRLPAELAAIVVDESALEPAYAEAVARRMAGEPFYVATTIGQARTDLALLVAGAIVEHSYDARRELLDQLTAGTLLVNGAPVANAVVHTPETLAILRDLHLLGDAVLSRSPAEYRYQAALLGRRRAHVAHYPAPGTGVPKARGNPRGSLVIWAPHAPWQQCTAFATAVEEMRRPVCIVAATVPSGPTAARYVTPEGAADALADAAAIVDATPYDPAVAIALANTGVPLAVAATSGACDYVAGVLAYDLHDWRSIARAAYDALGASPPRILETPDTLAALHDVLASASPPAPEGDALVSIVVPTYNRPHELRRALSCFARQTYSNVECIVVNDGGEPVDRIVAEFSFARLVDLEKNSGDMGATPVGAGAARARGTYLGFMADDDVCYPDHLARLVSVLERTGCGMTNGNINVRFVERTPDGSRTTGFSAGLTSHLDPARALVAGGVSITSVLMRRDLFERVGSYSTQLWSVADHELLLRLSLAADSAHVDHATTEWRASTDGGNRSFELTQLMCDQLESMWQRYPRPDRPSLERERSTQLANNRALQPGVPYRQPTIVFGSTTVADYS